MNFMDAVNRSDLVITPIDMGTKYNKSNYIGVRSIGLASYFSSDLATTGGNKFYVHKQHIESKIESSKVIDMRFMREFDTLSDAKRYSDKVYKRNNKFYVSRCHVALKRRQLLNWVTGLDEGRDFASSTIATIESVYGWMDKDEIIQVVKNTSRNVTRSQGFRDGVDSVLIDYTWNLGRYKA